MKRCLGCMDLCIDNICPNCGYAAGTPPEEISNLMPGTVLHKKYIAGKAIKSSAVDVTYIGWDEENSGKVAIKEFFPAEFVTRTPGSTLAKAYNGDAAKQFEAGLCRFVNDAQCLAELNGVNGLPEIYDIFIENNTCYVVTELSEGSTVNEIMKTSGTFSYVRANEIIKSVLKTLCEAHKRGIVHCNISPDSILITNSGDIRLTDFSAVRCAMDFSPMSTPAALKSGYAPLEQYRKSGQVGAWSDVYAVAATYYKMITGITPAEAPEREAKERIKPPSALGAAIPQSTENAVMNALSVDARRRTHSAEDFLRELESGSVERTEEKHKKNERSEGKVPLWLKIAVPALAAAIVVA